MVLRGLPAGGGNAKQKAEHAAELARERVTMRPAPAPTGDSAGMSWNGFNLSGDIASIKEAKRLLHEAGKVPALQDEIKRLRQPPQPTGDVGGLASEFELDARAKRAACSGGDGTERGWVEADTLMKCAARLRAIRQRPQVSELVAELNELENVVQGEMATQTPEQIGRTLRDFRAELVVIRNRDRSTGEEAMFRALRFYEDAFSNLAVHYVNVVRSTDSRSPLPAWQPIETAPKDGTPILAWIPSNDGGFAYVCKWEVAPRCDGGWIEAAGEQYAQYDPTHWRHLPDAPTA